jgi:hypothetical protein
MHPLRRLHWRLTARDFDRKLTLFRVDFAVLIGSTALGIPAAKVSGKVRPAEGEVPAQVDLCIKATIVPRCPMAVVAPKSTGR